MKFKIYFLIILSVLFTGCVSKKNVKMKDSTAMQMKGKTLVATVSEKPDFSAMTAEKAVFGIIGAAAMIGDGNRIVKENDVEDPARYIGEKLANDLKNKRSIKVASVANIEESDDINELANKYNKNDYILDVRTINWSFIYFPTDWDNYQVMYASKLRLIDVKNKRMIAEGFCQNEPEEQTENSPSYDQLVADQAKVLKKELQKKSDKCIQEFRGNILNI
ncbi:hypothetical protein [Sulfurovum mangrovi]|uniref:hypothetical protein n=1 Tax=Sulfurovum mangrovi TaxID=2893889 RepID=UPI001E477712|nr:hypothetical protein [Sulfurovum mangrovi]UFH58330.1 hypothetical protein LN246_08205 [Sulfurovum mangrovi]